MDALLAKIGAAGVAALDEAFGERTAWEADNPLLLRAEAGMPTRTILRTARVGRSLKRAKRAPEPPRYLMRPYRYLADSRRSAKGKPHMVLALHARAVPPDEIQKRTGCPRAAVSRYIADFEAGRQQPNFGLYYGKKPVAKGTVSVARDLVRQLRRLTHAEQPPHLTRRA